jgi:amino acid transporter
VIVCLLFAYFDIKITARVLGAFFVAEVGVLLIFAIAVLVQGGAHGLSAAPLNPLKVLKNKGAIATFGALGDDRLQRDVAGVTRSSHPFQRAASKAAVLGGLEGLEA